MKKINRKGFTIVELVIVIAVIAILAGVLIPTFSGVVAKSNQSAALQKATSAMKSTLAMSDYGTIEDGTQFILVSKDSNSGYKVTYKFEYEKNSIGAIEADKALPSGWNAVVVKEISTTTNSTTTLDNEIKNKIKAATGKEVSSVSSSPEGYYTATTTDESNFKIFVNTDYPDDLVTVTKSN